MEITQVVGVGLVATILALTIKQQAPEYALAISIMASILIFIMVLPKLTAVIEVLNHLTMSIQTNSEYIGIVLKIVGIAYIAEFGAQICMDAGQTSIASKIDLGGKILIMTISAPVLLSLLDLIIQILP